MHFWPMVHSYFYLRVFQQSKIELRISPLWAVVCLSRKSLSSSNEVFKATGNVASTPHMHPMQLYYSRVPKQPNSDTADAGKELVQLEMSSMFLSFNIVNASFIAHRPKRGRYLFYPQIEVLIAALDGLDTQAGRPTSRGGFLIDPWPIACRGYLSKSITWSDTRRTS